jgi:ribosomal protein S18 acetylase RimI-like enzyme
MENSIEIKFVDSWCEDEIVELYKAGSWWKETYDKAKIPLLISGSFVFAVVIDTTTKKVIGMGRILSDGVSDAYIQDVVILPLYRNQGIGNTLLGSLIQHCIEKGITWIGCIAEPKSEMFYKSLGFKPMKAHTPMLYHLE